MKVHPTTRLEWEVKDESNAIVTTLPPQRDDGRRHASITSPRHWRLIIFLGTLLLLAGSIGIARLVNQADQNNAETEREIELAVEADAWLRDPAAPKPQIRSIELQNDLAIVQMAVVNAVVPEGIPLADGTAYYRYSAEGWKRVEPDEWDWGPYRYQETAHLFFQYYQVDQNIVEAVVPAIEAFNTALHRDIGLELPPAHDKVTVRAAIVTGTPPADPFELVGYVAWESDGIVVLSPRFFLGSTTLATTDTLTQAVEATVAHRIMLLAVEEYQPQVVWRPLIDGLQLWAYAAHREFDFGLANQMNVLLSQQLADEAPLRLPVLSMLPPPLRDPEVTPATSTKWQQSVVLKSVIDYIVATYGRRSLARLLDGMHQYDSWQSLIPAVFSVSADEFERGWQAYLAAQNDLHP